MGEFCNGIDPRWYYAEIIPNLRRSQREVRLGFGTTPTGRRENYRIKLHRNEKGETVVERVENSRSADALLRFMKHFVIRDKASGRITPLRVDMKSLRFILLKLRLFGDSWLAEYIKYAIQLGLMESPTSRMVTVQKMSNRTRKKQRLTRLQRREKRQRR